MKLMYNYKQHLHIYSLTMDEDHKKSEVSIKVKFM